MRAMNRMLLLITGDTEAAVNPSQAAVISSSPGGVWN